MPNKHYQGKKTKFSGTHYQESIRGCFFDVKKNIKKTHLPGACHDSQAPSFAAQFPDRPGGSIVMGDTPIAGWFLFGKIPNKHGWWLGVPGVPLFQETTISSLHRSCRTISWTEVSQGSWGLVSSTLMFFRSLSCHKNIGGSWRIHVDFWNPTYSSPTTIHYDYGHSRWHWHNIRRKHAMSMFGVYQLRHPLKSINLNPQRRGPILDIRRSFSCWLYITLNGRRLYKFY